MTREEQLKSCTICTHRCMDMHKGLLCGLTQNAANFEGVCPNFEQDEKEFQKQQQIQQEVMNDENHTIGGWLAFFLWIGIGFGALMSVVIVCLSFSELLISTWLVVAQLVTLLCLCTIAISTIVAFYKRKSNAKALAYTYIATIVIDGIFAIAMYFAIADAQEMNLIDSIRSILWGIIWGTYLASSTRVEHIVPRPRTWHIFEKILAGILVCMYILMAIVVIDMQNNENSIFYNPRQVVKTILQEANKDLPYQDIDGTIQQCLFLQEDTIVYPYKFTQIDIKDCVVEDLQLTGIHTKQTILQEVALESTDAILSGNEYFFEHNYSVSFRYYIIAKTNCTSFQNEQYIFPRKKRATFYVKRADEILICSFSLIAYLLPFPQRLAMQILSESYMMFKHYFKYVSTRTQVFHLFTLYTLSTNLTSFSPCKRRNVLRRLLS